MNAGMTTIAAAALLAIATAPLPVGAQPAATAGFPRPAGSWGGIVRSGPGQQYARVASLKEGERVTLLARTDVIKDDYPWFKIRFRGTHEGYQWGGILCAVLTPETGLYQSCP
jgi:hypothetical protein